MTAPVAPLLTRRQRAVLDFIRRHYTDHGYCPSLREVAAATGLASPSTANHHVQELQRMGWITRVPGRPRTIRVLNPADGSDT